MATTYLGIDGGIGRLRNPDYSGKIPFPPGTKGYTYTFARMGIDGGIIKHARSYAGKVELQPLIQGGVQAEPPVLQGTVRRTAFRTISGGIQVDPPVLSGSVSPLAKTVSGGISAPAPILSGTVTAYPLTGWSLTNFSVNHAGLDPDSPFTDPIYSSIVIGDKSHYETLTTPDSHTMTMDGLGEFTISPTFLTQPQEFDVQIYDASTQDFGTISTITVHPADADHDVSGGVQAQAPVLSGSLNSFTVHNISGGVQCGLPVVFGIVTKGLSRVIVGGVEAASPVLSGTIDDVRIISGGVQSLSPTVSGALEKVSNISGGVQAQPATVFGDISPPTEEPGSFDPRELKQKFVNRKVKWKSNQRKMR